MIISQAPMRVSFFGGGTDYPEYFLKEGGAVLATAINKFTYVNASTFQSNLFDYNLCISYRERETVKSVDEIRHNVFRECLRFVGLAQDIELHTVADLPSFTGLGSSSSFTVALLQALHAYKGEYVRPLDLAYEAIHVERNLIRDKVGCQDQTLAAVGGFNLVEFRKEDDIVIHRVPITPARLEAFEAHLFLVFTRITRRANDVVAPQLARVRDNTATLRAMRKMVDAGWDMLTSDCPFEKFGQQLHEAWLAKRQLDAGVSNTDIDEIYGCGMDAGAWGGKLLGAGGGGFVLFFAPPERHAALRDAFAGKPILSVKTNAPAARVIFS
jgi:D-glycero-alpha-D-manno-heptose-7-phosphate kinase